MVYNGEIYNYPELMDELKTKGHSFRTHCDTEVIVHAYEEYGTECPKQFRGMFAFALYDQKKELLFMARDRVGIKPFCYAVDGERLLFGSEIKPILTALAARPTVNLKMLDFYMSVG